MPGSQGAGEPGCRGAGNAGKAGVPGELGNAGVPGELGSQECQRPGYRGGSGVSEIIEATRCYEMKHRSYENI